MLVNELIDKKSTHTVEFMKSFKKLTFNEKLDFMDSSVKKLYRMDTVLSQKNSLINPFFQCYGDFMHETERRDFFHDSQRIVDNYKRFKDSDKKPNSKGLLDVDWFRGGFQIAKAEPNNLSWYFLNGATAHKEQEDILKSFRALYLLREEDKTGYLKLIKEIHSKNPDYLDFVDFVTQKNPEYKDVLSDRRIMI